MAEFYHWPRNACYLVTFMIAMCVLSQTLAVMASIFRRPRGRGRILETILELIVLGHVFVCSLEHGQAMMGYDLGLYTPIGFEGWRIGSFAAVALSSTLAAAETRKLRTLVLIAFAGLTLPFVEQTVLFPYLYVAAIMFFMIRSILTGWSRYREITTNISALSVKNAMDSLHTGVMFLESNGFIVLCNERMQGLMIAITGQIQRNGKRFFDLLDCGDLRVTRFEGHSVCHLEDGSAWMFKRSELRIKNKNYSQITATDITERWRLTERLKKQNEALALRKKELDAAIAGLHILSHERETQKARMRAHDILGERLTLLLRAIRNEQAPDYDLLRVLSGGLIDHLKAAEDTTPHDELDSLINSFGSLGVEIEIIGDLPSDDDKARLFVEIAREAVTNAVKHGFATEITIQMKNDHMEISDNGFSCGEVKEGGGLNGMRRRLERFGGALFVQIQPRFTLTVEM